MYKKEHKEEIADTSKAYYQNNKDIILQKQREYNKQNDDAIKERRKKFYYEIRKYQRYECPICSISIFVGTKAKHERSKKPQDNLTQTA